MQKVSPFLWFDNQAEEAVNFYTSIFKNSKIVNVARYGEAGPGPKDTVMIVAFQLDGQEFIALNGGPHFKFTEAISFVINCTTQEEVDRFWGKLSEGGEEGQCGWLKDKYGLSWQVVPTVLGELLSDKDAVKSQRVMKAMLQMKKIDIESLKKAYRQRLNWFARRSTRGERATMDHIPRFCVWTRVSGLGWPHYEIHVADLP